MIDPLINHRWEDHVYISDVGRVEVEEVEEGVRWIDDD